MEGILSMRINLHKSGSIHKMYMVLRALAKVLAKPMKSLS